MTIFRKTLERFFFSKHYHHKIVISTNQWATKMSRSMETRTWKGTSYSRMSTISSIKSAEIAESSPSNAITRSESLFAASFLLLKIKNTKYFKLLFYWPVDGCPNGFEDQLHLVHVVKGQFDELALDAGQVVGEVEVFLLEHFDLDIDPLLESAPDEVQYFVFQPWLCFDVEVRFENAPNLKSWPVLPIPTLTIWAIIKLWTLICHLNNYNQHFPEKVVVNARN